MMRWSNHLAAAVLACCAALSGDSSLARPVTREDAMRATIHPVASVTEMNAWLARVPVPDRTAPL